LQHEIEKILAPFGADFDRLRQSTVNISMP
jgi:hypothetical protein